MFLGTHTPRLDDKGRLVLPAKFRDDLAAGLVITRGQERSLTIWPVAGFTRFTERVQAAPQTSREVRDYLRMLFAGASDEIPDKQGRITVPPLLRSYAELDRECVVIGMSDRIEVWETSRWERYSTEHEAGFAELNSEVMPIT